MAATVPHYDINDTTPTELGTFDANVVTRLIQNLGSHSAYVSEDPNPVASDTDTGNGFRIDAGNSLGWDNTRTLYAICKSGESTVLAVGKSLT